MKRQNLNPMEVISRLVKGTCRYPEDCKIVPGVKTMIILPHMADYPIFIGRGGRQVNALKYIGQRAGIKIDVDDSFVGEREPRQPFEFNGKADRREMIQLVRDLCDISMDGEVEVIHREEPADDVQGLVLVVTIIPQNPDDTSKQVIRALTDLLYPYSIRRGFLMRVRALADINTSKYETPVPGKDS